MVEKIKGRKKSSNKIGPIPFYRPIPILPAPRKKVKQKKKSLKMEQMSSRPNKKDRK